MGSHSLYLTLKPPTPLHADHAEAVLGGQRYLLGDRLTGPDIRLFHTLVRYDEVYHVRRLLLEVCVRARRSIH